MKGSEGRKEGGGKEIGVGVPDGGEKKKGKGSSSE